MDDVDPEVEGVVITCPICREKTLEIKELVYEAPYFGRLLIVSRVCKRCGYSSKASYTLEEKEPIRLKYRIDCVDDLKTKVARSEAARILIPELGASIEPGLAAEAEILTVEAILDRIREKIVSLIEWSDEEEARARAREILNRIEEVLEGKASATLIIEDPRGVSQIVPAVKNKEKVKIEPLKL